MTTGERTPPRAVASLGGTELRAGLWFVWRRKLLIGSITAIFGVLAFVYASTLPRLYQARTVLLARSSSLEGGRTTPEADIGNMRAMLANRGIVRDLLAGEGVSGEGEVESFVRSRVSVEQIRGTSMLNLNVLMRSPDDAARIANSLAERAIELNRRLNQQVATETSGFLEGQVADARTRVGELEQLVVQQRNRTRLDLSQAQLRMLVERLNEIDDSEFTLSRDLEVQSRGDSQARLLDATRALLEFRQQTSLAQKKKSLETKLAEQADLAGRITRLTIESGGLGASLATARSQLPDHPKLLSQESALETSEAGLRDAVMSPFLNPTRQVLERQVVTTESRRSEVAEQLEQSRIRLAVNEAEYESLHAEVADLELQEEALFRVYRQARDEHIEATSVSPESRRAELQVVGETRSAVASRLEVLQERLYGDEVTLDRLELELEVAQQTYRDLAKQYQESIVRVASGVAELQVVDPALTPATPVSPRRGLMTFLGLLFGAVAGLGAALVIDD